MSDHSGHKRSERRLSRRLDETAAARKPVLRWKPPAAPAQAAE